MANAREALHAIVEPDQLQIARVRDQIELDHQMKASPRDGKTRTAAAFATGADATSVAFAAHQTVAALLAAWREALAAKVFVPISNDLGTIVVPVADHLPACTPAGTVGQRPEGQAAADWLVAWRLAHGGLECPSLCATIWVPMAIVFHSIFFEFL